MCSKKVSTKEILFVDLQRRKILSRHTMSNGTFTRNTDTSFLVRVGSDRTP